MRAAFKFIRENLKLVVILVLAASWGLFGLGTGLINIAAPLSLLFMIAMPAGLIILVRFLLEVLHLKRDEDEWEDWRDEPFKDPARDGELESTPDQEDRSTRPRKPSFAKTHRRSLWQRTQFWSLHKHAKGGDD